MRTLDRNFLMNNPAGTEKAKFSVSARIPLGASVPNNPDGTRARVTIDVEADTWMNGLTALGSVGEFGSSPELVAWVEQVASDDEIKKVNDAESDEKASALLSEIAARLLPEYESFEVCMGFTGNDDKAFEVTLTVKAPSVAIAALALESRAESKSLMNTAIALSPERDNDDYGDDSCDTNEVLVVS